MEYTCIFDRKAECPVKQEYKLQPESLVEFCKVCNKGPCASETRRQEFETFLNITRIMGDMARQLGEQTAKADIYQKLYDQTVLSGNIREQEPELTEAVVKKLEGMGFFKDNGKAPEVPNKTPKVLEGTLETKCPHCGKTYENIGLPQCPHCGWT